MDNCFIYREGVQGEGGWCIFLSAILNLWLWHTLYFRTGMYIFTTRLSPISSLIGLDQGSELTDIRSFSFFGVLLFS